MTISSFDHDLPLKKIATHTVEADIYEESNEKTPDKDASEACVTKRALESDETPQSNKNVINQHDFSEALKSQPQ